MVEPEEQENQQNEYTIEIVRGGRPRKTRVREIEIDWEGKKEKVVIKKLTYGERAEYVEKFMNVGMHNVDISIAAMQVQAIIASTHTAPFPINEDYVRYELDGDVGEIVYDAIESFNKLNSDTTKNSDGPSSTEPSVQKSTESSTTSDSDTISE